MGSLSITYNVSPSRILITSVVDQIAKDEPGATWVVAPGKDGYRHVTYREFANAINGTARWLEKELGKNDKSEPLAFFGTGGGDIRYPILMLAAVKAGFYTMLNSPRNSIEAHINLFKLQTCKTVVLPEPYPPYVAPLLKAHPMRELQFPNLEILLNDEVSPYPYNKTFDEACKDPWVSLHTSGSTGLPKPRTYTLESANHLANNYLRPSPVEGTRTVMSIYRHDLVFSALPFFHAAAIVANVCAVIFGRQQVVLAPPGPPVNAAAAIELIKKTRAKSAILAPSTLDDIGKTPHLLDALVDLHSVTGGGGAIAKVAGDAIITKTRLLNILGTTEIGALSQLEVAPEDWNYIRPSPLAGSDFRHYADDSYEMFMVRDEKLNGYQPTFDIFPELSEYSTHDLFRKHPTKPDHWLYTGRSDDVIVFLNGEKTNPTTMEYLFQSHSDVSAALVAGQGRFEAALLVEPLNVSVMTTKEKADFIERLWPTIQEANQQSPAHARISKSHILFTSPEKPMSRASKGTVQRRATLENYTKELDALYADAESMSDLEVPVKIDTEDLDGSVLQVLKMIAGIPDLTAEDDFFTRGMDSLQVIQTARSLKAGLENAGIQAKGLAPSTIYSNPSVTKLAAAVKSYAEQVSQDSETLEKTRLSKMDAMLEKYSNSLPSRASYQINGVSHNQDCQSILLTGSTGALGSYLLEALINSKSVSTIYCLNRTYGSKQRQSKVNSSRGLATEWDSQRVKFLTSDYCKADLGLGNELYSEVVANANVILHNAWQVDFNLSLDSYEPQIQGITNLIDVASKSAHQAKIFFLSSIGAVMNRFANHSGPIPEEVLTDYSVSQPMGYAESKHISERLLALANKKEQVPVRICRVGQIAGPIQGHKGMWNKQEWLPSLILSSEHLGLLPDSLGTLKKIDWIPIDSLAAILMELAIGEDSGREVYHTINPKSTSWDALLPSIKAEVGQDIKVVPLATWIKALKDSSRGAMTQEGIAQNPAVKLLDFYIGLLSAETQPPQLETVETEKASNTLRELGPVKGEWMVKWIKQWRED